jgi:imidazolonepropionase-like amidohydrolase
MKLTRLLGSILILTTPLLVWAEPVVTVLQCGRVFDSVNGRLLGPASITIEGTRIKDVLPGVAASQGANAIDLRDLTCLPGLIDSHVHLTMEITPASYHDVFRWNPADYAVRSTVYANRTLQAGFTTVRNLGDINGQDSLALRDAINVGVVPGPRIFTAGVPLSSSGGHGDPTNGMRADLAGDPGPAQGIINGTDDAVKAVRLHYKAGADLIKIMPSGGVMDEGGSGDNSQMTPEEIRAVVTTAHDYGFTVAAHAHGAEAIRRAAAAGVDSIEHGSYLDDAGVKLMKEHGTWLVPTLSAGAYVSEKAKVPGYYPPQVAAKAMEIAPKIVGTAGRAYKAGVKIAFGTDGGVFPHGDNAHEFELMVEAGMPPAFTLQAATIRAAELLRKEKDLGSIEAGKFADVIAVAGDPVANVGVMRKVAFVMKDGHVYRRNGVPLIDDAAQ